ncbi:POU domain, class 2, transcription factor 2-like [Taeniopygia guttata]|uniref:POU domain, class 2, transcription factor 2-like n=1 Tax=Taeniopygia guttata TaxID=59729 RepID=UPI003BB90267
MSKPLELEKELPGERPDTETNGPDTNHQAQQNKPPPFGPAPPGPGAKVRERPQKSSPKYPKNPPQNIPKILPKILQNPPQNTPKSSPKSSPKYPKNPPQNTPKISPKYPKNPPQKSSPKSL